MGVSVCGWGGGFVYICLINDGLCSVSVFSGGLGLDLYMRDRLYWYDQGLQTIKSCASDGTDRVSVQNMASWQCKSTNSIITNAIKNKCVNAMF